MARPLRLEYPGALWWVTGRGAEKRVFQDDEDRRLFLGVLENVVSMFRWRLYSYVLMEDGFHLVVETPEANLSRGMRQLNGIYTQAFNRRHDRQGPLLQGRFKSVVVEREEHFLELIRWMFYEPMRQGMSKSAADWSWSSYRETTLQRRTPEWLDVDGVLSEFDRRNQKRAAEKFRKFITEGKKADYDPRKQIKGQIFLGSDKFRQAVEKEAARARRGTRTSRPSLRSIVSETARAFETTPREISHSRGGEARTAVAYLGRLEGTLTLREIGDFLKIDDSAVSRLVGLAGDLMSHDRQFRSSVERVRGSLN
jgi:putative transposase